jgi:O-acetyl-ADP-ribose deacetylase (regulator of RNase III)
LETYRYRLKSAPERRIAVRTGAIQHYTEGMDVWVNSENTHLQMARYFDRSLSAVIRYWGARKDVDDEVVEDTIADELGVARGGRISVAPGSVLVTGAGALTETHGVQKVFHVASVMGVPGQGWVAVPNVWDCVTKCLRRADSDRLDGAEPTTIAFPMLGTGHGGVDVYTAAPKLIQAAVSYLREHSRSRLSTVYFMAWNGRDLEACLSYLEASDELEREPG